MEFADQIEQWARDTESRLNKTLQKIVLIVGTSVINLSPVDTGLFKGNWQLSYDGNAVEIDRLDKTGGQVLAELGQRVEGFTAGQVAYIQNQIFYGNDLEHYSSRQAPEGMVRITAARFNQIVQEALALNKE